MNEKKLFLKGMIQLQNHLEDGIYIKSRDLEYIWCNSAYGRILGRSIYDIIHKSDFDLFTAEIAEKNVSEEKEILNSGTAVCQLTSKIADSHPGIYKVTRDVIMEDGDVIGLLGIVQNRSRQSTVEMRIKQADRKAKLSEKIKTEFLANLNHEIRTSLNAITGFSQILSNLPDNSLLPDEYRRYLGIIMQTSQELAEQVNNILELSKIKAGRYVDSEEHINPLILIRSVFHLYKTEAAVRQLDFTFNIDPGVPEKIKTSRFKIGRLLMLAVESALNETPPGSKIKLQAAVRGPKLAFTITSRVADETECEEGITYIKDDVQGGFTYHADGFSDPELLAKELAQSINGSYQKLFLDSGKRAVMIKIPTGCPKSDQPPDPKPIDFNSNLIKDKMILVVEDSKVNQYMLKVYLEQIGLQFIMAENGKEALDLVTQSMPDLIIMDLHMPEMNGFETCRAIRAMDDGKKVPIVIMTADSDKTTESVLIPFKISDILIKPVKLEDLNRLLFNHFARPPQQKGNDEKQANAHSLNPFSAPMKDELLQLGDIPIYHPEKIVDQVNLLKNKYGKRDQIYLEILDKIEKAAFKGDMETMNAIILHNVS